VEIDPASPEVSSIMIAGQAVELKQKESLIANLAEAIERYQTEVAKMSKTIEGQRKTISYLSQQKNKMKHGWGPKLQERIEKFLLLIEAWKKKLVSRLNRLKK
jgi:predicted RNase H-like nuclease (RuvC/YqgF family)